MAASDNVKKKMMQSIENLARSVTEGLEIELVDIDYKFMGGKPYVIVFIDKPGGVFLTDCERVNKSLGELLDLEDPFPSSYTLEVSSPGAERPLKRAADFRRFVGNDVKIKTGDQLEGRRNFTGTLKRFEGDFLILQTEEGKQVKISLKEVAKANLYYKNRGRKK